MIKLRKYKLDKLNEPLAVIDLQLVHYLDNLSNKDIKLVNKLDLRFGYHAIFEKGVISTYGSTMDEDDKKKYEQKYGKLLEIKTYVKDFVLFVPIHTTFIKNSTYVESVTDTYKPTYKSYLEKSSSIRRMIAFSGYLWGLTNMTVGYEYAYLNHSEYVCSDLIQNKPIRYTNGDLFYKLFNKLGKSRWINKIKMPTDYLLYLRGVSKNKNCAVCIFNYDIGSTEC